VYNNFTNALQALSTSPDNSAARSTVIGTGQLLAQQLNQMSNSIQSLRGDAELGISNAVTQANIAMRLAPSPSISRCAIRSRGFAVLLATAP
jgi:flagellar hook-associated protein 1 FlgK